MLELIHVERNQHARREHLAQVYRDECIVTRNPSQPPISLPIHAAFRDSAFNPGARGPRRARESDHPSLHWLLLFISNFKSSRRSENPVPRLFKI